MRIVFMGTPDFAAVSLQRLLDERFDVVGVFTQPDKPKNRGMKLQPSPVKEIALAAGLPVFQPAKMRDGTALADLQSLRPDILVVVAYGRILPDDLPPVRLLLPGDNPKKRGLTRTVNPDDSHLFAFLNAAGDIIKDPFIPVQLTYVLYI